MKASKEIREKIKEFEGLRLTPYRCSGGVWTVGYGHTGKDFDTVSSITPAQAAAFFDADIASVEAALNAQCSKDNVSLTQRQFDALISFAFNLGMEALRSSTLWRKVKADTSDSTIPAEFRRWVYAKGVKLPGLVNRREQEARIYMNG